MTISDIKVGDEIGGTRVVFIMSYLNRENLKIYNFIGIDKKGIYILHRSDASGILYKKNNISGLKLQYVILELFELIKKEIKLTHSPWMMRKS